MVRTLVAVGALTALMSMLVALVDAEPVCTPKCSELLTMESVLFQDEFNQDLHNKYLHMEIVPRDKQGKMDLSVRGLQQDVLDRFTEYMQSPAGAGEGKSRAAISTKADCTVVIERPDGSDVAYDRAACLKEGYSCWECEVFEAHEGQHVAECENGVKFNTYFMNAAGEVRGYGAGVRKLRDLIAENARRCGWEGSIHKTKRNPVDKKDETVVPTPEKIGELLKALKKAPTPAGKGKKK